MKKATGAEVLAMLIPTGGWVINADDFDSIRYDEGIKPISKKQFEAAFDEVQNWKITQDAIQAQAKAELLNRLGITAEEAQLLLS